jgi:hypothetical protein
VQDITASKQIADKHIEGVGLKVAKDFGSLRVYFGSVIAVEYDSDDDSKANPFYCMQYTDGDKEDLNEEEFGFAREPCIQIELDAEDAEDDVAVASGRR